MDIEHLQPAVSVWYAYLNLPVESAPPANGRIEGIGPVGGRYHYHLSPGGEAVHQGEDLGHHPPLQVARDLLPLGSDGIDLIDEYDGRSRLRRFIEYLAQPLLALAIELGYDLRPGDGDEVGVGLACHRSGDERLSRSRRTMQEHPPGRIDSQPAEELWMAQRNLDHLSDLPDLPGQAADVLIGYVPHMQGQLIQGLSGDADDRLLSYQNRPVWHGAHHCQVEAAVYHLHPQHLTLNHCPPLEHAQEILLSSHEADLAGGGDHDLSGGPGRGPADIHPVVYSRPQVGPGVSVDPDYILGVLRSSRPCDGIDLIPGIDLHYPAVLHSQLGENDGIDPGHSLPRILMICFSHSKQN